MKPNTTLAEAFEEICASEAPLNERLSAYAEKLRELNFPFAEAYDALVARVLAGEVGRMAPAVGEPLPDFVLPGRNGQLVNLDDVTQRGPAVISFNRGHWCSFCKIELKTIAQHHEEITAAGAEMVSIIPERQQFTEPLRTLILDRFQILSDVDNGYALSLGLVMWIGEHLKGLMKGRGYHLETSAAAWRSTRSFPRFGSAAYPRQAVRNRLTMDGTTARVQCEFLGSMGHDEQRPR